MLVYNQKTIQSINEEDHNLNSHLCENFKQYNKTPG
jgi:hypothetical protein